MRNDNIDQMFAEYPNVTKGVKIFIEYWKKAGLGVKPGKDNFSIQFSYTTGHNVFRIDTPTDTKNPTLVIYSGMNDLRRGSLLVKGATDEGLQRLINDFNIPENEDGKPDFLKTLSEDLSLDFYTNFIEFALEMISNLNKHS